MTTNIFRRITSLLLAIIALCFFWYTGTRALSSYYAVTSYQIAVTPKTYLNSENHIFRVGSYNIAHGRGGKKAASNWHTRSEAELSLHLDKIARQIAAAKLDVVVLNEVDFSAAWSSHLNQAVSIAERAGYKYLVEQRNMDVGIPFFDLKFGNAVLSHHPIESAVLIEFTPYSFWEGVLAGNHDGVLAELNTPLGKINIVAVHLEYRREDERVFAAKTISQLANNPGTATLAIGDFNSTPTAFTASQSSTTGVNAMDYLLTSGGFEAAPWITNQASYFTFPSAQPTTAIDWILKKGRLEFTAAKVIPSNLSDHLMIMAELKMKK